MTDPVRKLTVQPAEDRGAGDALLIENRCLRERIRGMLLTARDTERKLTQAIAFEARLLAAADLGQLLCLLLDDLPREYGLDRVEVILIEHDSRIREALHVQDRDGLAGRIRLLDPVAAAGFATLPYVGAVGTAPPLPGGLETGRLRSLALLPLRRAERCDGWLILGSQDPQRYLADMDTYIVNHLAAIVATCLANALASWQLAELGVTDALTGVRNRRYFDQRLRDEVARAVREGLTLGCLFADIDHFKRVNDTHGHGVGDRVIAGVARRLQDQLRGFDLLARYGGEEFVMLLAGLERETFAALAERMRQAVASRPLQPAEGVELAITLSIGGVWCTAVALKGVELAAASTALVAAADDALLQAKREGRNRVIMRKSVEGCGDTARADSRTRER